METSFSELRQKDVINIVDGSCLGRTCDVVFTYPEGKVCGIVVPGSKGFRLFRRNELFIELKSITKIGEDVVMVNLRPVTKCDTKNKKHRCHTYEDVEHERPKNDRRNYEEYE